jgi:hypothetical protein
MECRKFTMPLYAHPAEGVPAVEAVPDEFGTAEHWKEKAQYWAGVAHRLRSEALRGDPVDGITQPAAQGLDAKAMSEWLLARRSHLGSSRESAHWGEKCWDNYTMLSKYFAAQAKQGGAA